MAQLSRPVLCTRQLRWLIFWPKCLLETDVYGRGRRNGKEQKAHYMEPDTRLSTVHTLFHRSSNNPLGKAASHARWNHRHPEHPQLSPETRCCPRAQLLSPLDTHRNLTFGSYSPTSTVQSSMLEGQCLNLLYKTLQNGFTVFPLLGVL